MAEARNKLNRQERFLREHPWCCLCGGLVAATTIEHAPPKVFFINKEVPAATHRMPACERCNNGSSAADQVAALVALIQATVHREIPDTYLNKLMLGVFNNSPDAFAAIANGTSSDVPLSVDGNVDFYAKVEINNEIFDNYLNPWAAKQAYALHYLHSEGAIIPSTSRVMVQWYTNAHVVDELSPDTLLASLSNFGELRQGRKHSELQYSYKWQFDAEIGCIILMLHDSSMVLLGIFQDEDQAEQFPHAALFATNSDKGIFRID